jgi:hypothetical protein
MSTTRMLLTFSLRTSRMLKHSLARDMITIMLVGSWLRGNMHKNQTLCCCSLVENLNHPEEIGFTWRWLWDGSVLHKEPAAAACLRHENFFDSRFTTNEFEVELHSSHCHKNRA